MGVDFYEVMPGNLVPSLVRLLAKIYESQQRCVFVDSNETFLQTVDKALWTFSTKEFIPHGDKNLGFSELQPIYFTPRFENPNNAKVLVIAESLDFESFQDGMDRILLVFEKDAEKAEEKFHVLKNCGKNVNYWKQSAKGWGKIL